MNGLWELQSREDEDSGYWHKLGPGFGFSASEEARISEACALALERKPRGPYILLCGNPAPFFEALPIDALQRFDCDIWMLDPLKLLGDPMGFYGGTKCAIEDAKRRKSRRRGEIIIIHGSFFTATEVSVDRSPILTSVLSRFDTINERMVVLCSDDDLPRLAHLPQRIVRYNSPTAPNFLVQVKPDDGESVGREKELNLADSLLEKGRSVLFVGPSGTGKTYLARKVGGRKRDVFSLSIERLRANTSLVGQLENKMQQLYDFIRQSGLKKLVVLLDELPQFGQRTGNGDGRSNFDSPLDKLKSWMDGQNQGCLFVGTMTDQEYEQLYREDPAILRRFSRLDLLPPSLVQLLEIVNSLLNRNSISGVEADEIIEAARIIYPGKNSPGREVELIAQLGPEDGPDRLWDIVRARQGELAAPRPGWVMARLREAAPKVGGRGREWESIERAVRGALRRDLIAAPNDPGPWLCVVLLGTPGSGKTHLARTIAEALCPGRVREIPMSEIKSFAENNQQSSGALIINASVDVRRPDQERMPECAPASSQPPLMIAAMESLQDLRRWLVVFVFDAAADPEVLRGSARFIGPEEMSVPMLVLPLEPARLDYETRRETASELFDLLSRRARRMTGLDNVSKDDLVSKTAARELSPYLIESLIASALLGETDPDPDAKETTDENASAKIIPLLLTPR